MPGSRYGMVYSPSAVVRASFDSLVAVFTVLIAAPGTAEPVGSVTWPVRVARKSCAPAATVSRRTVSINRYRMLAPFRDFIYQNAISVLKSSLMIPWHNDSQDEDAVLAPDGCRCPGADSRQAGETRSSSGNRDCRKGPRGVARGTGSPAYRDRETARQSAAARRADLQRSRAVRARLQRILQCQRGRQGAIAAPARRGARATACRWTPFMDHCDGPGGARLHLENRSERAAVRA